MINTTRKLLAGTLLGIFLIGCGGGTTQTSIAPDAIDGDTTDDATGEPVSGDAFTLNLSLQLGILCLQSYQMLDDFNSGKTFTLPPPYTLVKVFNTVESIPGFPQTAGDVPIAFVATEGNNIYVVFRGTDTIDEWIQDAKFAQVSYSFISDGGLTEQGFTEIYATLNQEILSTLSGLIAGNPNAKIFITGHSLGGALAVLAAPEIANQSGFPQPTLYTFAGPRAGNPHFAETTYDSRLNTSWRVVNTNDLVPFLPKEIVVVFENNQPKYYYYEHVNAEEDVTFGNPVTNPTDVSGIEFNHAMCNYYNTLCAETSNPTSCQQQAAGIHGCN